MLYRRAAFHQYTLAVDAGFFPPERRPRHSRNVSFRFLELLSRCLADGVQRAEAMSWAGAWTWWPGPSGSVSAGHGL